MKAFISLLILTSLNFGQSLFCVSNNSLTNKSSKTVFGYLPWWEYTSQNHLNIKYDLLTHLALFSFEADSLGDLRNPPSWPWNDVISKAKTQNVKLIMTVSNFKGRDINKFINENSIRQKLFINIRQLLLQYNFDGVNIDFENLNDGADKLSGINSFMKFLNDYVKSINQNLEVSFASPSYGYNKWDFQKLSENCDYLFVMQYDYFGSWSSTTGPSSPLTGNYLNITNSFELEYKNVSLEKLVFGVPYYGNYWKTKSSEPYTPVIPFDTLKSNNNWQSILRYNEVLQEQPTYQKLWDNLSQTSWMRKKVNDTTWLQIWYDDTLSLSLKYDFAIQKNLKGIGIWALGYDNNRSELWNLIKNKFFNPTTVQNEFVFQGDSYIENFPNPFNSETIIKYNINEDSFVTLKMYNVIGEEIVTIVNDFQFRGLYQINFNSNEFNLTSGVYILRGKFGNKVINHKLVLLK
jgi:spore germination protein YaaH